jgi:23S rRNA pseudouridine2605 synthase
MRINQFIAQATGCSRRAADTAISEGRVKVNGTVAPLGQSIASTDHVSLDDRPLKLSGQTTTIMLNKPVGYVCSRDGQGSKTIYDLLPSEYHHLKPVGRLDKDSSGLLLLTNDGQLAHQLTHPSFQKAKVYEVELDKPLTPADKAKLEQGIILEDGPSKLSLTPLDTGWQVTLHEGRNRQIRRTFVALGYQVARLHRTSFGSYHLGSLGSARFFVLA